MDLYNMFLKSLPNELTANMVYYIVVTGALLLICSVVNFILNRLVLKIISKVIRNNKLKWDDVLLETRVFQRIGLIVPGMIIYSMSLLYNGFRGTVQKIALIYVSIVISLVVKSLLEAIDKIYRQNPVSRERPIKGLLQILEIGVYLITGIAIISILLDKNPIYLLSGLGAATAVVSFIFKDLIVGFVSGIQLTWNDMLRIGDWVEMSKYGADGEVVEISLYSVKIQNWDKTISTIPTSAFVTDSFKNWRGMRDYGGRRIKRSFNIDMTSIKICSQEMIEKFKKIDYLKDYLEDRVQEIKKFNQENRVNTDLPINGRQLTNLGVFRVYITKYIKNRVDSLKGNTTMVRQLAPGENGIPLEIYLFVGDTRWLNYESIQADIFDHILAVIDIFDLRVFQNPTGYDIRKLKEEG